MMDVLLLGLAAFLLGNLLIALRRVLHGPTDADRMLAALLFGSTGVAVLLLLAEALSLPPLIDTALIFVLLSVVAVAAFTQRAWREGGKRSVDERS